MDIVSEKVHEIIGTSMTGINYELDSDLNSIDPLSITNETVNMDSPDDPDDPCKPVFEYLINNEEIETWNNWNPSQLRKPLTSPLDNARSGTVLKQSNISVNLRTKKAKNSKEIEKNLLLSKLELTNIMKKHMTQKALMEQKMMEAQLKREELKIKLLESQMNKQDKHQNGPSEYIEKDLRPAKFVPEDCDSMGSTCKDNFIDIFSKKFNYRQFNYYLFALEENLKVFSY
ncbi:uncharacterized protein [Prorops nasuta]|uniref:uncharacterized protein n=1 Tax=Prorops nasuta TaxID=863751 RepID=UPI0034CD0242